MQTISLSDSELLTLRAALSVLHAEISKNHPRAWNPGEKVDMMNAQSLVMKLQPRQLEIGLQGEPS